MSLKRATYTVRPRTREVLFYRMTRLEREIARRERRSIKLAEKRKAVTDH